MHEKTRYKSEIAILDNAHLKVQTLCYFMLKSDGQMEIKSHLLEIIQFCFLSSVLLFLYLSVLLKPNSLKKWKNTRFSHAPTHFCRTLRCFFFGFFSFCIVWVIDLRWATTTLKLDRHMYCLLRLNKQQELPKSEPKWRSNDNHFGH